MIPDEAVAAGISSLFLEISARLNQSLIDMQGALPDDEWQTYRESVARIMGDIYLDVLRPLFEEHPRLKPPGLE
jgi:hypothetical protein